MDSKYIPIFEIMNTIGIIGCGWLGIPLGKALLQKGYAVHGTRRSEKGIQLIKQNGISAFQLEVLSNKVSGDLSFFSGVDSLLISIPPERKKDPSSFVPKIKSLLKIIQGSGIQRLLFLSSSSVYGKSAGVFNENTIPTPETKSAKALYEVEQMIMNCNIPSMVVRLGGLIGEDRNPIVHLQDRKISNPKGSVNFVHQIDAINGISALIELTKGNGIYNLVSPHHPTRKEYYTFIADKLKFPKPKFEKEQALVRVINGEKIVADTTFDYNVNNLLI
jgi:nucleoside-diphosphate-sugar epimerase